MTNPPDRVWVVIDPKEGPEFVTGWRDCAHAHINGMIDLGVREAAQWVVCEYRTHRPIPWRTGVPDAETRRRCGNRFALLLPDGDVFRHTERGRGFWYLARKNTHSGLAFGNQDIAGWCPEDEMPEETQ